LYYKYGFKSMGLRRKYYQDNSEDALVLWMENITTESFREMLDKNISDWKAARTNLSVNFAEAGIPENVSQQK
jgi:hypothetical protein